MRRLMTFTYRSVLTLACVLSVAGCVDDNISVFVAGNIAPEITDGVCLYSDKPEAFLPEGAFNIDAGGAYSVNLLVLNQLRNRATSIASDPNGVNIQRAEIELQDEGGTPLPISPNPYSVPVTGFVESGNGVEAGQAPVRVRVLPVSVAQQLQDMGAQNSRIIAQVRLLGETNGTIDIETGQWQWPVQLCGGNCLFVCAGPEEETSMLACEPGSDGASLIAQDRPGFRATFCGM